MSIYDSLNKEQQEAVYHTEGPLLILAGAGSGKTRVLTHRIAWLIEEKGVNPWNILAITFTNKAAGEMRERVDRIVGHGAESIWVSTFHSMCVRILRRYIDRLGYERNFSIYDTDDQKTMIKEVCRQLQIDTKKFRERSLMGAISGAKNSLISPEDFAREAEGDFARKKMAQVYAEYEKQMKANNALDFDDLLVRTVQLFETCPDVLENYQERFRYIMVDEYQDTNFVQFRLVSLLAGKYRNLCVVGDDDQSIYKFRGADIRNILDFELEYPDAHVVKLEQNYRSVSTILDAANAVIHNNKGRKEKSLWTEKGKGEPVRLRQFDQAYDEAEFIVNDIRKAVNAGRGKYQDYAVLYRTNAQSRILEEKFVAVGVPYKIVGGINFYSRREIKDILAYLKTMDNGQDDLAVRRIINVPRRGIGLTTISRIQDYAASRGTGFYEAVLAADLIPGMGRSTGKVESFAALIEHFKAEARNQELSVPDILAMVLEETGYQEELQSQADTEEEYLSRVENLEELKNKAVSYEEACREQGTEPSLSGFLEEVALVADIDSLEEGADYVVLMTLHSAKGLEFPHVYLAGMEDGLFPSYMTITSDSPEELEEERRLCYVGITRAMDTLCLTCARKRMVRGELQYNRMSRFVNEIPPELLSTGEVFSTVKKTREESGSDRRGQTRQSFYSKPFQTVRPVQNFGVKNGNGPGYDVGDRVRHIKFGEGTVTRITEGGRDYEVTVDFDGAGTKKMFAMFAKLQKIE